VLTVKQTANGAVKPQKRRILRQDNHRVIS
jgi:hypothetical protein